MMVYVSVTQKKMAHLFTYRLGIPKGWERLGIPWDSMGFQTQTLFNLKFRRLEEAFDLVLGAVQAIEATKGPARRNGDSHGGLPHGGQEIPRSTMVHQASHL